MCRYATATVRPGVTLFLLHVLVVKRKNKPFYPGRGRGGVSPFLPGGFAARQDFWAVRSGWEFGTCPIFEGAL